MKISIIGSGSGGFAMAAYLTSIGHEVCVFSKSMQEDDSFHLKASGIIKNKFKIKIINNDYNELVKYSNLILVVQLLMLMQKLQKNFKILNFRKNCNFNTWQSIWFVRILQNNQSTFWKNTICC